MSASETLQRNVALARERCDRALAEFQRAHGRPLRELSLRPFEGEKLSIAQLCAECGLEYRDGLVHTPPLPLELRRSAWASPR